MAAQDLSGLSVAILALGGFEQAELTEPRKALQQAGAEVRIVSARPGQIQGFNHDKPADKVDVDLTLQQATRARHHRRPTLRRCEARFAIGMDGGRSLDPSTPDKQIAMQRKHALAAVIAAVGTLAALPSFAQPNEADRRGPEHREMREPARREGPVEPQRGRGQWEREVREPAHFGARGPEWHQGGHIPREYRDRAYVVTDWRAHRLAAPPRGHEWVQVGPDYVLVAVRTGVIARIVVIG